MLATLTDVTPTQLRAFSAVVRHGSVKEAAAELGVSESAVSIHVAQLRKELEDQLFTRTAAGLAVTPGGLRLASRATEMLGLQDRTIREVSQAGSGRRLLRVAASSLFAEHAAPGLIEMFAGRADDLDVELSVRPAHQFEALLAARAVDVTIGPRPVRVPEAVTHKAFLNYQVVLVVGSGLPLAGLQLRAAQLRDQTWLLGPSAVEHDGAVSQLLRRLDVHARNQQIYQSHSAALDEARRNKGVAPAVSFAVRGSGHRSARAGRRCRPARRGRRSAITLARAQLAARRCGTGLRGEAAEFDAWRELARDRVAGTQTRNMHFQLRWFAAFADARVALHVGDMDEAARATADLPTGDGAWWSTRHWPYDAYYWAIAAEVAVAADLPDADRRLAAAQPAAEQNAWAAACIARTRGRRTGDAADFAESLAAWERIEARFERAVTLALLPGRVDEGHAELAALGCAG